MSPSAQGMAVRLLPFPARRCLASLVADRRRRRRRRLDRSRELVPERRRRERASRRLAAPRVEGDERRTLERAECLAHRAPPEQRGRLEVPCPGADVEHALRRGPSRSRARQSCSRSVTITWGATWGTLPETSVSAATRARHASAISLYRGTQRDSRSLRGASPAHDVDKRHELSFPREFREIARNWALPGAKSWRRRPNGRSAFLSNVTRRDVTRASARAQCVRSRATRGRH